MFEFGARLLARGAAGALAAGFISLAMILILARPSSGPLMTWWNLTSLAAGTPVFALWFTPLTMVVLPLASLAFRRSRYQRVVLFATSLFGGVAWSIELLRDELAIDVLVACGALSGLATASCFLGLHAPALPVQPEQPPRNTTPEG